MTRYFFVMLIMGVIGVFIIAKGAIIMFAERQYWQDVADRFVKENVTIKPNRGNILSADGKLMASSLPEYKIFMDFMTGERDEKRRKKEQHRKDSVWNANLDSICIGLNKIFPEYSVATFKAHLKKGRKMKSRNYNILPSRSRRISYIQYKEAKRLPVFKMNKYKGGFHEQIFNQRKKPFGSLAARTLGDLYADTAQGAKNGIELAFDTLLKGRNGITHRQKVMNKYLNIVDLPPVDGCDIISTIDVDMQDICEKALVDKLKELNASVGVAVLMEVQTGEVKAIVNMMKAGDGNYYEMRNNAISDMLEPGSTFKTAQALTFLQEGIVGKESPSYPCSHGFIHRGLRVGCHGHASPLPLVPAIATSCNAYFCWGLYYMFGDKKYGSPQNAITVWKDHMVAQGFGYRLGTDLPGEQRGLIPNAQFYDKAYRGSWNGLTVISIAIGQGEILATPLQIANLGATIANRGWFITPHIVKDIEDNPLDSLYVTPRHTGIDRQYYDWVAEGMRAAVTGSTGSGTCRMVGNILPDVEACGKTGTAQNPHGKDHSVFMGFAPMNDPQIAIVVYVENGGWGATYGVPIGALMMDQYLHGHLSPENEKLAEDFSKRVVMYGEADR